MEGGGKKFSDGRNAPNVVQLNEMQIYIMAPTEERGTQKIQTR